MALARIVHEWSDGQVATMEAGGDMEDCIAAVVAVLALWRECVEGERA